MSDPDTKALVFVVVLIGIAGTAWYFRDQLLPPAEEPVTAPAVAEEPETNPDPSYPLATLDPRRATNGDLVPLPALNDSDGYFLLETGDLFGADLRNLLVDEAIIDKFVATVDNLPRAAVSERVRPVGRLATTFDADDSGPSGPFHLGTDNFRRYNLLVAQLVGADLDNVVDMYRRFYPLFQESYEQLGYPGRYFNDRVVEVIDHLLETPEPQQPIRLVRPNVLYEFADPELEARSSGQKLLLRIGPDHAARLKRVLREFRARIT